MRRAIEPTEQERIDLAASRVSLTHAQALWTLREVGLSLGVSPSTFAHYVKALRKLGIPFENKGRAVQRRWVRYEYESLMELAVALALRVYAILPDVIPTTLRNHRQQLYAIYRQAIRESDSGLGAPIRIGDSSSSKIGGVYLDLLLGFEDGYLIERSHPRVLGPKEAIERFALADANARSCLPLNLSRLGFQILETAERAPSPRKSNSPEPSPL